MKNSFSWPGLTTALGCPFPVAFQNSVNALQRELNEHLNLRAGSPVWYDTHHLHCTLRAPTGSQPVPVHSKQAPDKMLEKIAAVLPKWKEIELQVQEPTLLPNGHIVLFVESRALNRLIRDLKPIGKRSKPHITIGWLNLPPNANLSEIKIGPLGVDFSENIVVSNGVLCSHYMTRTLESHIGKVRIDFDGNTGGKTLADLRLRDDSVDPEMLLNVLKEATKKGINKLRHLLYKEYESAIQFVGGDEKKPLDDRTRRFDEESQAEMISIFENSLPTSFVVLTEEPPYEIVVGNREDASMVILMDPADSSDLMVAWLGGAVALTAIHSGKIIAAVVGDVKSGSLFYASDDCDGAYVEHEIAPNSPQRIAPSDCIDLGNAFGSTFGLKSKGRWEKVIEEPSASLGKASNRFSTSLGGPLPLVLVAAGKIDYVYERFKGYKNIDLYPGMYIAQKAGAVCKLLDGNRIPRRYYIHERCKFICAATPELFKEVNKVLTNP